jgi:cyanate permease
MIRAWVSLAVLSLMFFLGTAATFTSLGVVLPAMVKALGWNWTAAGFGFSLLGVAYGLTSSVPALMIRRIGVRLTLLAGSLVMVAAFLLLAAVQGLPVYFLGCTLAGLGFTLLSTVPGTYLLARLFAKPSMAFGLYFTLGGLGGVIGPQSYLWMMRISGDWRAFWMMAAAVVGACGVLTALAVDVTSNRGEGAQNLSDKSGWRPASAMRTRQFAMLAAAYSIFLLVGITVNATSVPHLQSHGVSTTLAASMLSLEAFLNAGARLAGGALARLIDARKLLLLALALMIGGLLALSAAREPVLLVLYAAGIGIGYGLTFFASTILLLDYFGRAPNLELFATVNLISTLGAVGPVSAGFIADHTGSFVPAFLALAAMTLLILVGVAMMRPPQRQAA